MTAARASVIEAVDEEFSTWGVEHGGCAVVDRDGIVAVGGDIDELLPWASVTKVAAALAVLSVVEDGSLGLDDPAGPAGSTVRHLLSHASGLAFDEDRTLAAPGRRRIYSNIGIDRVVAAAVRAARISSPSALLQDRVFGPLGMTRTRLVGPAAHGAEGPVADLARLAHELLEPRVLGGEVHDLLLRVDYPDLAGVLPGYGRQVPNDWALGVERRGRKDPHWTPDTVSPDTFGHFGQSGSFLWVDPHLGMAAVALTGTAFGPWAVSSWPRSSARWVDAWLGTGRQT